MKYIGTYGERRAVVEAVETSSLVGLRVREFPR